MTMNDDKSICIRKFTEAIGVTFNNPVLIRTAFTHRSYVNEHRGGPIEHNERLEFLGDAVLELVVTRFLFDKYPEKTEGDLTAYRAALVNTNTISDAATKLSMNDCMLLSKGEARDTGRARQYILANAFESVIGAIYLDQGYDTAKEFIAQNIFLRTDDVVKNRLWQDSKSHLQEEAQERVSITPSYAVLAENGPDHDKQFTVGAFLGTDLISKGVGKSKQEAEQAAAEQALKLKGWL
ncbi:MAG: ribonuclease III [Candidatus Pacebacteria bacterium]|nr:ribonuclease III [Candidatus Paceibacterota bacterium]